MNKIEVDLSTENRVSFRDHQGIITDSVLFTLNNKEPVIMNGQTNIPTA